MKQQQSYCNRDDLDIKSLQCQLSVNWLDARSHTLKYEISGIYVQFLLQHKDSMPLAIATKHQNNWSELFI